MPDVRVRWIPTQPIKEIPALELPDLDILRHAALVIKHYGGPGSGLIPVMVHLG